MISCEPQGAVESYFSISRVRCPAFLVHFRINTGPLMSSRSTLSAHAKVKDLIVFGSQRSASDQA